MTSPSIIRNLNKINVDEDEHVTLMLENPTPCFDVLARLYLGYVRKEPTTEKMKGTRLDKFFTDNKILIEDFLDQAIGTVDSFQIGSILQMSTCTNKRRNV